MIPTTSVSRDAKLMKQVDQISAMRDEQMNGLSKLPTIEANRNPKYQIRKDEADGYVHVRVCNKHFQSTTKQIELEERIITIHKAQFQMKVDEQYFAVYDEVEVIHDPRSNAPHTYDLKNKEGIVKLDTPIEKQNGNTVLTERVKALKEKESALSTKEQELIAKQTELEQREAKLKEAEVLPSVSPALKTPKS